MVLWQGEGEVFVLIKSVLLTLSVYIVATFDTKLFLLQQSIW